MNEMQLLIERPTMTRNDGDPRSALWAVSICVRSTDSACQWLCAQVQLLRICRCLLTTAADRISGTSSMTCFLRRTDSAWARGLERTTSELMDQFTQLASPGSPKNYDEVDGAHSFASAEGMVKPSMQKQLRVL